MLKLIEIYYNFFDKKLSDSTIVVWIIWLLIYLVWSISYLSRTEWYFLKWDIISSQKYHTENSKNIVSINWIKYMVKFEEIVE